MLDLRGRPLDADLRPEVDLELPGRHACLGEIGDADDPPDAHVELLEVLVPLCSCVTGLTPVVTLVAVSVGAGVVLVPVPVSVTAFVSAAVSWSAGWSAVVIGCGCDTGGGFATGLAWMT